MASSSRRGFEGGPSTSGSLEAPYSRSSAGSTSFPKDSGRKRSTPPDRRGDSRHSPRSVGARSRKIWDAGQHVIAPEGVLAARLRRSWTASRPRLPPDSGEPRPHEWSQSVCLRFHMFTTLYEAVWDEIRNLWRRRIFRRGGCRSGDFAHMARREPHGKSSRAADGRLRLVCKECPSNFARSSFSGAKEGTMNCRGKNLGGDPSNESLHRLFRAIKRLMQDAPETASRAYKMQPFAGAPD